MSARAALAALLAGGHDGLWWTAAEIAQARLPQTPDSLRGVRALAEREGWAKDAAQAATAYAVGSRERATVIEEQEAAEKALKAAREELRQAAIERSKLQAEDDA